MACPLTATVAAQGIKTPDDFDADSVRLLVVQAPADCNGKITEACSFKEPRANGKPHLNLLLKASKQYRWKPVAGRLLQHYKVPVDFGTDVKT